LRNLAFATSTALLILALTTTASLAVTVGEATGNGTAVAKDGTNVSIQFKAGVDDTNTYFGQLQENEFGAKGGKTSDFHGDVRCYVELSPTVAVFGGLITSASDPSLVGQFYEVKVVEDSSAAPHGQFGIVITRKPVTCLHVNVKLLTSSSGDITVH